MNNLENFNCIYASLSESSYNGRPNAFPKYQNSKEKEDFPKLVQHVFTIKDKTDLVISGLGWIRVTGTAKVAVWAPEGVAVVTRKAII